VPYHIYHKVLNAKNYGVPQNRERVFIVGIRDDCDNIFTWPKKQHLTKRLKDVLEDDVDEKYYLSDKMIDYLNDNSEIQKVKGNGFKFSPTNGNTVGKAVTTKCGQRMDDDFIKVVKHERTNQAKIKRSKSLKESGKDIGSFTERQMIAVDQNYSDIILANANPKKEGLIMIGAIRGRNPENPLSREVGLPTEQRLELNLNGNSNALTTVQKDNMVVYRNQEPKAIVLSEQRKHGKITERDIVPTLLANTSGGDNQCLIKNEYSIRRLTPRECFRLMDFPDTFTWPVSNSQAYKQAGNSIVVAVLASVISKLN
jgi:DNA (cytosine-5)-methyltransferase 1